MSAMYKVLLDGRSMHGGTLAWSLPTQDGDDWVPGDWHTVEGPIEVCERGLHLTSDPTQWLKAGCEVYLAEGRGDSQTREDKTAFAAARLLRPAPEMVPDWWRAHERFIAEISRIPWCQPDGNPKPEWVSRAFMGHPQAGFCLSDSRVRDLLHALRIVLGDARPYAMDSSF